MKTKISIIAFIALFVFTYCTNENEVLNGIGIEKEESQLLSNEEEVSTVTNLNSINIGDTIFNFSGENGKEIIMRSSNSYDELSELVDFPLNIVVRELNSSARYLTHQGLFKEIILKNYDGGRNQIFYLKNAYSCPLEVDVLTLIHPLSLKAEFVRKPVIKAKLNNPNTETLNVVESGFVSTWNILPSQRNLGGNGAYIFYSGENLFPKLCMQAEGTNIRFGQYMERGTQEFEIRPKDNFDMVSLELFVDNSSFMVRKPDFYVTWDYNNNTNLDQTMSTNFSKRAVRTSTFSRRHSLSLSIASTLKVGGAFFVNGQISTTASTTNEWTYGQTEQIEDSRTYNFPITIPKKTRLQAVLYVAQYEMNIKYKAIFKGQTTGKFFTEIGDWKGVDCTDIRIDVQTTDSNGIIKNYTFYGIPSSLNNL